MESIPIVHAFNTVDMVVIGIIALSTFVGLLRGVTREVLGLFGWAGAILAVLYGLPTFRPLAREYISNPAIADIVLSALIFLIALIVLSLLSRLIANRVQGSILGGLDRSLGLIFGVMRGGFFVCLIYLLGILLTQGELPQSVQTARSEPFLESGARLIQHIIPSNFFEGLWDEDPFSKHLSLPDMDSLPSVEDTVKTLSRLQPVTQKENESQSSQDEKSIAELIGDPHAPQK